MGHLRQSHYNWHRIGSRTSGLRLNTAGAPIDCHRIKKACMGGFSWPPSGLLTPGDALKEGRADTRRLLRLPPPPSPLPLLCLLTPSLPGATAAPETARPLAAATHGR